MCSPVSLLRRASALLARDAPSRGAAPSWRWCFRAGDSRAPVHALHPYGSPVVVGRQVELVRRDGQGKEQHGDEMRSQRKKRRESHRLAVRPFDSSNRTPAAMAPPNASCRCGKAWKLEKAGDRGRRRRLDVAGRPVALTVASVPCGGHLLYALRFGPLTHPAPILSSSLGRFPGWTARAADACRVLVSSTYSV